MSARPRRAGAPLALVLALGLSACSQESGAAPAPSERFECSEGCGTCKTMLPGETPPPCCGAAMLAD